MDNLLLGLINLIFGPKVQEKFMCHLKVQEELNFNCRNLKIESSGNDSIFKVLMLVKYHPGLRETQAPADTLVKKMERQL